MNNQSKQQRMQTKSKTNINRGSKLPVNLVKTPTINTEVIHTQG